MTKQQTITVETSSLLIVRGTGSIRAWCSRCGQEAEMVALGNVGVISNLDQDTVENWINAEDLHHSKAADGSPVVCLNSLLDHLGRSNQLSAGRASI